MHIFDRLELKWRWIFVSCFITYFGSWLCECLTCKACGYVMLTNLKLLKIPSLRCPLVSDSLVAWGPGTGVQSSQHGSKSDPLCHGGCWICLRFPIFSRNSTHNWLRGALCHGRMCSGRPPPLPAVNCWRHFGRFSSGSGFS